ncbi:MAG: PAS domain S-box protein [Dehalococcoidia bacterium]
MAVTEPTGGPLYDLIETIRFTESVSTKIHGRQKESEIFRIVTDQFSQIEGYTSTILLLTGGGRALTIEGTSLPPAMLQSMERVAAAMLRQYRIDLQDAAFFNKVAKDGETILATGRDIIGGLFEEPLKSSLLDTLGGLADESSILTPIYRQGKIIGILIITSEKMVEPIIPSIRNLARHISTALDLAEEYAQRELASEELRKRESELSFMFDSIEDGIVIVDLEGNAIDVNEATLKMGGFDSSDEIIGQSAFGFVAQSEQSAIFEALSTVMDTGRAGPVEFTVCNQKGETFAVEAVATLLKDRDGNPSGVTAVYRDITERKKTEEALQRSERYFRLLIENAPDMFVVLNEDITIRYGSPSIEKIAGYAIGELVGTNALDFVHPDDRQHAAELLDEGKKIPGFTTTLEIRLRYRDGSYKYFELTGANLLDDPIIEGVVLNFRDIDVRKKTENALKERERYFRLLIENAPDMIVVLNEDTTIRYVSPSLERIGGYPAEKLIGANGLDFVHPDDLDFIRDLLSEGTKIPGFTATLETRLLRNDGTFRYVEMTGTNMLGDPTIGGIVLNFYDIEVRKQAENTVKESEAKYRALFESTGTPIVYFDREGCILLANKIAASYLDSEADDLIGKSIHELIPEKAAQFIKRLHEVFEKGKGAEFKEPVTLSSGERWLLSNMQPVVDSEDNIFGVQVIASDITELKVTEDRIEHLNAVLRAIRNINELIIREEDRDQMIQKACEILIETKGYKSAWIALMDSSEQFEAAAESGLGERFLDIENQISKGDWPVCARKALQQMAPVVIESNFAQCAECLLAGSCNATSFLSVRLEYAGRVYGVLCVGRAIGHHVLEEERALFEEVAGDIAFALQGIELENERAMAEEVLKESEDRFKEIFENANDEIIYLDPNGIVINVNKKVENIFGYTQDEVIGKNFAELGFFLPDHQTEVAEQFAKAMKSKKGTGLAEFEGTHKNGKKVFIEASLSAIKKRNKIKGLLIIVRDITARKGMEERLNQYSAELEQRLTELQIAYEKLKELDRMKDAFLSTVSHELRTPLTSIKSFAEILLTYESDAETQREFLQIINDESDRLTRLINDTLDLAKIESGQLQWETTLVDMTEVINTSVNTAEAISSRMNLSIDVDKVQGLPKVWGDRDRLIQVMTNLISNAIKFSPPGGKVLIKAETIKAGAEGNIPEKVQVSVTDEGRGIAPEDQELIFEKFTQVGDTLRDKPTGTGLGLPICKEIIEHYNGEIWVESDIGEGSTFSFSLPVMLKTAGEDGTIPDLTKEETEKVKVEGKKVGDTILVVDDETNIRRFLRYELTMKGYQVIEASNGKEAIALVKKHHPDLITMDVVMPDLDGFQVASELKSDPETRNIPIIMVSVMEDKQQALSVGASDYVTKPFGGDAILEKVTRLLRDPQGSILVVDDDEHLVKSIDFELQQRGYSTSVAHDGEEALKVIEQNPPDLIILDIMMPKLDGHQVIKALKSRPETSRIPIIVLTGVEVAGERMKAFSLGANEYLVKSGGLTQLFETAANILSPSESSR